MFKHCVVPDAFIPCSSATTQFDAEPNKRQRMNSHCMVYFATLRLGRV